MIWFGNRIAVCLWIGLPEGFCAEDPEFGEREEGGVDRQAELYGQLRRHHARQDQSALKEQLIPVPKYTNIIPF